MNFYKYIRKQKLILFLFIIVGFMAGVLYWNEVEPFHNRPKTTLITHIYNEEYMLPFWLSHHKTMFDDLIVIDYKSTDRSLELCKQYWHNCRIIPSRNESFNAELCDKEVMDIESTIDGVKMVLNTTEFLLTETKVENLLPKGDERSYSVECISPYSSKMYEVKNNKELFQLFTSPDVVFHKDRMDRQLHNFKNGSYSVGRHSTSNKTEQTDKAYVIWFGYFPMNEELLKRKLQIKTKIPESDKQKKFGWQHLAERDELLGTNNSKAETGVPVKDLPPPLNRMILAYVEKYNNSSSA